MNKLLKTTGVFILGVGLLTGCSHTSSQNQIMVMNHQK